MSSKILMNAWAQHFLSLRLIDNASHLHLFACDSEMLAVILFSKKNTLRRSFPFEDIDSYQFYF
ncbi:hypothetical protein NBRC3293_0342 [Gluconobacter oxydans NBRC 3293]|uniref:Uncharacterized protein n=1 Tax=Gluconobacter oxydans NBRC 3293 TaxID=1315969 RepID=A0A829WKQ8_GLUOY|nr:hypothetical protein NBRC3293_0342 [Gluconobacter oxydans NBRC 3293]